MPTKFRKLKDFEEITIHYPDTLFHEACCDCGLVHYWAFHVYRGRTLGIAFKKDKRATAQLRRHKYGYLQQGYDSDKYQLGEK